VQIDETDRAILTLLQADARLSFREIARRAGVSTPTAAARVRMLESLGVIRGYRAVLDPAVLGRTNHVLEVEARPADAQALAARLAAEPGVEEVLTLAGGRLLARHLSAGAADLQAFLARLSAMPDVQAYRLHHVLADEGSLAVEPGPSLAVPCHECKGPIPGAGVRKAWPQDGGRDHWFCCRNCAAAFETRLAARAKGAAKRAR
jgi:Lrp/AsnC family leucine-responsive transcriptional regulator